MNKFKIGDKVRVKNSACDYDYGRSILYFPNGMEKTKNKVYNVLGMNSYGGLDRYLLDGNALDWEFHESWLELVTNPCADILSDSPRVPIGITPKFIHDIERRNELVKAITRYMKANLPIPEEWVEEYHELIGRG